MTIYTAFEFEDYAFNVDFLPGFTCDGKADLVHDAESGTWGTFYVKSFTTTKGETYTRGGCGNGSSFTGRLFDLVSKALEADADAIEFFAEEVADYRRSLREAAE